MTENLHLVQSAWKVAPETSSNQKSKELDPVTEVKTYIGSYLNYKCFRAHPNWFDPHFDLTLEVLATDPVVHYSRFYKESEEYFKNKLTSIEPMIDQDPKTKLNIYRANFHAKIDFACQLIMANRTFGDFNEWVGKDRVGKVLEAMQELRTSIGIKKMLDTNRRELIAQLETGEMPHNEDSEKRLLTDAEKENFKVRIAEAEKLSRVKMEEINRAFALAELFYNYMEDRVENKAISGKKKNRLFIMATKNFKRELPKPTPSINVMKYKPKDLDSL